METYIGSRCSTGWVRFMRLAGDYAVNQPLIDREIKRLKPTHFTSQDRQTHDYLLAHGLTEWV